MSKKLVYEVSKGVFFDDMEGAISLFTDRVDWRPLIGYKKEISIKYEDMSLLKISSEVKGKLYLRVITNDETAHTFHFNTPDHAQNLENRNKVKSLIAKLMAAFKRDNSSGLNFEKKNQILTSDPILYQSYKELVVAGLISTEDFWSSPFVLMSCPEVNQTSLTKIKDGDKTGIPTNFWSLLAPISKGCNEISLNLSLNCINAIFLAYPAVKEKFAELVPNNLTERDFWTQFFQAQYFYRNRAESLKQHDNMFLKIFFEADAKFENEEDAPEISIADVGLQGSLVAPEGYGGMFDEQTAGEKFSMSRRFNLQSRTLLKTFQDTIVSVDRLHANPFKTSVELYEEKNVRTDDVNLNSEKFSTAACGEYDTSNKNLSLDNYKNILEDMEIWRNASYSNSNVIQTLSLTSTLQSLSVDNESINVINDSSDPNKAEQNILHYRVLYELLRNFWSSFPLSKSSFIKIEKSVSSMEQYYELKYLPWCQENNIQPNKHIGQLIEAAKTKFHTASQSFKK